jgi:L-alanine-DL-glutamate epimerase-like enolase superfamily enzyme
MVISDVQALPLSIPLLRPVALLTREVRAQEHIVTRIKTDTDYEGLGYAYIGTGAASVANTRKGRG